MTAGPPRAKRVGSSAIEIIAASAGTGKTWRLARAIEDEIVRGGARPEGVVATTFTRRAAAELEERVRRRLLAAGRTDEAERLGAARIGTVNAIAGRLAIEFALDLGLSPELAVLDERAAADGLRRALAGAVGLDEQEELAALAARMADFDWQAAVGEIVALARDNGIAAGDLAACARRSEEELRALLGPAAEDGAPLEAALLGALDRFVAAVDPEIDGTKATAEALANAHRARAALRAGRAPAWKEWAMLARLETGARSRGLADEVRRAAAAHERHPRLHADALRMTALVFEIAGRALDAYDAWKRGARAIDFVDQEALALRLLETPAVADRLREEIDLVVVDEFQDTSPIQLAIFLRLAAIARRSIWVGDQKQSIYGFRGTDPALMDAAIETILAGSEPETLDRSWRSRPALVRLTSDLFARAFERVGIPARRVRLEPARESEAGGLGPVLERWRLDAKTRAGEAGAVAAGVRALLGDAEARVRDPRTGGVRPVRAEDVAVLCRTNEGCAAVARALEALGVPVAYPRAGLFRTPEGRAVLAGLRLYVDPEDVLAAAEVTRIVDFAGDADGWLEAVVEDARALARVGAARRVREARARDPALGPLAALDLVMDAIGAIDLCLRFGDPAERGGNLEALRAHAVAYVCARVDEGLAATPAGLVAHLDALALEGRDDRPPLPGEAVTVMTWHGAKGLEFPIAVLFDLGAPRDASPFGVRVACDRAGVSLDEPLAGRWIRAWISPYHPSQTATPLGQRAAAHPSTAAIRDAEARQALRLLYVAWTRARDRLVIAAKPGAIDRGILAALRDETGPLLSEPALGRATWAGHTVEIGERDLRPAPPVPRVLRPGEGFEPAGPREHPPAYAAPSSMVARGRIVAEERIGPGIPLAKEPDWQALGDAVHRFFAADRPGLAREERREIAAGLVERYGLAGVVDPEAIVREGEALDAWIERRWPGAVRRREWPVFQRREDGTIVKGFADLVIEIPGQNGAPGAFVIVDHKTLPPGRAGRREEVDAFAGQLGAYARGIGEATGGWRVGGVFVHLVLGGRALELGVKETSERSAPAGA